MACDEASGFTQNPCTSCLDFGCKFCQTALSFDLYWSFRSPYSYIAAQRLLALRDQYGFTVNVRIVRPLAVRSPEFFEERDSRWIHYVLIDVAREAE